MRVLETDRLILRWLMAADAPFVLELLNDPDWIRYIGDRGVRTVEDARGYIRRGPAASYERFGFGLYLVELKGAGTPIGICGPIRRESLVDVDLGFAFLHGFRGKGYAFEAASAALDHARRVLGIPRIVAVTTPDNHRSIELLLRLGFRFERMARLAPDDIELLLYAHDAGSAAGPGGPDDQGDVDMESLLREITWGQFGAAIDTLERAVNACPEGLWGDRSKQPEYWYTVYHTLFWLDYHLSETETGFTPPEPFGLEEMDPAGLLPPRVYTKAEMLAYLGHGRRKCRARIAGLTAEGARRHCGFERRDMSVAELLLYNMRHVQHHAAQLYLILRRETDSTPGWVGRARMDELARV